jgi:transcriptional regulator with XRE-family HTH domain
MTPKKKTQKQLALEYGLSKATLNNYQKDGVDIHNKQQVLDYAMGQNVCNANEDRDLLLTEDDVEDVVSNTPTMLQLKLDKLRHETAINRSKTNYYKLS